MPLPQLYPAQVGSPYTTLSAPYTAGNPTMAVADASILPPATNVVCLAGVADDGSEGEFTFSGKSGDTLTGVVQVGGPTGATWPAGTFVYRGGAAYDHDSVVEHLTYQRSHLTEAVSDLSSNLSYTGSILADAEAGEALVFGDVAVLAESGKFVKADPATLSTLDGTVALVVSGSIAPGGRGEYLLRGLARNDSWSFAQGRELYAGAGTLTHEPPAVGTQLIRKMGTALSSTIIEFAPSSTIHAEHLISVLPVTAVTKDNNDIERKFWKDDFSVDSSDLYAGDLHFSIDATNTRMTYTHTGVASNKKHYVIDKIEGDGKYSLAVSHEAEPSDWLMAGIAFCIQSELSSYYNVVITNYTSGQDKIHLYRTTGGSRALMGVADIDVVLGTFYRVDVVKVGSSIKVYVDGSLKIDVTNALYTQGYFGTFASTSASTTGTGTAYFKDISYTPAESYSDDFTANTVDGANGRYQALNGSVSYDGTNDLMVITSAGAGVPAPVRLKSYKFGSGSIKTTISMPTGDGYRSLVRLSADGLLTAESSVSIHVVQSGAAYEYRTYVGATQLGTSVSCTCTSVQYASILIERDVEHGVWYVYCWNADTETQPTTPTFKIFTYLYPEVYWGVVSTSLTCYVKDISIRAESIVGRTNVEVEEDYWFRDEFNEDSIGRWSGTTAGYTWDTANSRLSVATNTPLGVLNLLNGTTLRNQTLEFKFTPVAISSGGYNRFYFYYGNDEYQFISDGTTCIRYYNGVTETPTVLDTTFALETEYSMKLVITGTVCEVYKDGMKIGEFTVNGDSPIYAARFKVNYGTTYFTDLQITGTRIYNKPIHRGAMLETYHDGTQEVVGTTFIDDCQWDTINEWDVVGTGTSFDSTKGQVTITGTYVGIFTKYKFKEGVISFTVIPGSSFDTGSPMIRFCSLDNNFAEIIGNGYNLGCYGNSSMLLSRSIDNTKTNFGSTSIELSPNTPSTIQIVKVGNKISFYQDGIFKYSITDSSLSEGYIGFGTYNGSTGVAYSNIQIIAASPDATNGIAACIPPIGGGARYDMEEGVYASVTPGSEIPVGPVGISPDAKSTVAGTAPTAFAETATGTPASLEYPSGTKPCPGLTPTLAPAGRHLVKADLNTPLLVGVKGTPNSPAVFIDALHLRRKEVVA